MNRFGFNLSFWGSICLFYVMNAIAHSFGSFILQIIYNFILSSIYYGIPLIVGYNRIKTIGRSQWNIIFLFIPFIRLFYALWLGTTTKINKIKISSTNDFGDNRLIFNLCCWSACILYWVLTYSQLNVMFYFYLYEGNKLLSDFFVFFVCFVNSVLIGIPLLVGYNRNKALGYSRWNLILLFIPFVRLFYSLWLGITTNSIINFRDNRLVFNLCYWPAFIIYHILYLFALYGCFSCFYVVNGMLFVSEAHGCPGSLWIIVISFIVSAILQLISLIIAGFRIKVLGRSLLNVLWLFIPLVNIVYALWLGITTDRKNNEIESLKKEIEVQKEFNHR